jgi:hypothetical protein
LREGFHNRELGIGDLLAIEKNIHHRAAWLVGGRLGEAAQFFDFRDSSFLGFLATGRQQQDDAYQEA